MFNSYVGGLEHCLFFPSYWEFDYPNISQLTKIDRFPICFFWDGPLRNSASSGSHRTYRAWHFSETTNGGPHRGHPQQAELHVHVAEGLGTSVPKCWENGRRHGEKMVKNGDKPWESGGTLAQKREKRRKMMENCRKVVEHVGKWWKYPQYATFLVG